MIKAVRILSQQDKVWKYTDSSDRRVPLNYGEENNIDFWAYLLPRLCIFIVNSNLLFKFTKSKLLI